MILPRDNENDLRDVPEHARHEMELLFAERIKDALGAIPGLAPRLEVISLS